MTVHVKNLRRLSVKNDLICRGCNLDDFFWIEKAETRYINFLNKNFNFSKRMELLRR